MTKPLKVVGQDDEPQVSWQQFLERRTALEAQMSLEVCNGCDHCGTRCVSGFGVAEAEWEAVKMFLSELPETERERLEKQTRRLPWPGAEDLELYTTFCRFRDMEKNQCSIYPVRPTICRLFGQTSWLPCPIEAVPAYPEGAATLWNAYRTEKRKTWEEWQEEEITGGMSNG